MLDRAFGGVRTQGRRHRGKLKKHMTGPSKSDDNIDKELQDAMKAAEDAVDAVRREPGASSAPPSSHLGDEIEIEADEGPAAAALQGRIDELERDLAAAKDRWLRAMADHENFKKRVKRETEEAVQNALRKVLQDILPVADNLERALQAQTDPEDQVAQGVKMVKNVFDSALLRQGITPLDTVGKPFDPAVHDALQQFDSPDHAPGVIIQEFERGYMRGDKLFRPARVIVAGPGSTGEPPAAEPSADEAGADSNDEN